MSKLMRQEPTINQIIEYSKAILEGAGDGVIGLGQAIAHPLDNVIYPVASLVYDAAVIGACHFVELGNPHFQHSDVYRGSLSRMTHRIIGVERAIDYFIEADGPQRARVVSEMATAFLLPGGIVKGVRAANNLAKLGVISAPRFTPQMLELGSPPTPGIKLLTVEDIRGGLYNTRRRDYLVYIISEDRKLSILANHIEVPNNITAGTQYFTTPWLMGHRDFGWQNSVYAAGELRVRNGFIYRMNNDSGCYCPNSRNLEAIQKRVFNTHGFVEVNNSRICEITNQFNPRGFPNVIPDGLARPLLNNLPLGVVAYATSDPQTSSPSLLNSFFPAAYGAQAAQSNNFAARNPYYFNTYNHLNSFGPFNNNNSIYGGWASYLPTWQMLLNGNACNYNSKPSSFEMNMKVSQLISSSYGLQSTSSLKSMFESYFGNRVSSMDFYSAFNNCSSEYVTLLGGSICSKSALSSLGTYGFASLLAAAGLSSSYNGYHDVGFNSILATLGLIGGVANSVGKIEGPLSYKDQYIFALKANQDGKLPFSDSQLKQISYELYQGIYGSDSFPFFSLHFNVQGELYPVIHPCYLNTEVGRIVGELDYRMKAYLNGGEFAREFFLNWHKTSNQDLEYLRPHVKDFKESNKAYMSLREALCLADLESSPDEKNTDPNSVKNSKFRTSFCIIAKQNGVQQHDNIYIIDPDFDIEHSVEVMPDYQEYLDQYYAKNGKFPDDYLKLIGLYQVFANKLKEEMRKIPSMRDDLQMLGVINFLCHHFHTLKLEGKSPKLEKGNIITVPFPKKLPPLPVRYYQKFNIKLTLEDILTKILTADLPVLEKYLYDKFWADDSTPSSDKLKSIINNSIKSIILKQTKVDNIDKDYLNNLVVTTLKQLQDLALGTGNALIIQKAQAYNKDLAKFLNLEEGQPQSQDYKKLKIDEEFLSAKETPEDKVKYLHERLVAQVKAISNISLQNSKQKYSDSILQIPITLKELLADLEKQKQEAIQKQTNEIIAFYRKNIDDQLANIPANQRNTPDVTAFVAQVTAAQTNALAHMQADINQKILARTQEITNSATSENQRITELLANAPIKQAENLIKLKVEINDEINALLKKFQTFSKFILLLKELVQKPLVKRPYLHSALSLTDSKSTSHNVKIVGGCGMELQDLIPTPIIAGPEFLKAINTSAKHMQFNKVTIKGQTYHTFSMNTQKLTEQKLEPTIHTEQELCNAQGYTPLMLAAASGNKDQVLKHMADNNIDTVLPSGMTAFYLAVQNGHQDTALAMLESGHKFDINKPYDIGYTPLHIALELKLTKLYLKLIEMGADLSIKRCKDDYLPIHVASSLGLYDAIEQMVKKGCNINTPVDSSRKTSLHIAAKNGHDVNPLLKKGANPDAKDNQDNLPISDAIKNGHTKTAQALVSKTTLFSKNSKLALHVAAQYGMFDIAYQLSGHTEAIQSFVSKNTFTFTLFPKNNKNQSAQHAAAQYGMFDTANQLYLSGWNAILTKKDKDGYSYLYYLVKGGQLTTILTLEKNINFWEEFDRKSLLAIAAENGHLLLVDYLIEKKVPYKSTSSTLLDRMVAMDNAAYLKDNLKNLNGLTTNFLLADAARYRSRNCLTVLLPCFMSHFINIIMVAAIEGGDAEIFSLIWQHIEKSGLKIHNIILGNGESTIAHYATNYGRIDILQKIHDFGNNLNIANSEGLTPTHIAINHKDTRIIELFKKWNIESTNAPTKANESKNNYLANTELNKAQADKILNALAESSFKQFTSVSGTLSSTSKQSNQVKNIRYSINYPTNSTIDNIPLLHYVLSLNPLYQSNFAIQILRRLASHDFDPLFYTAKSKPLSFVLLQCECIEEVKIKLKWLKECFRNKYNQILAQTDDKELSVYDTAIKKGNSFLIESLDNKQLQGNALHEAALSGNLKNIRFLLTQKFLFSSKSELKQKAQINTFDEKIFTPLMYAAQYGYESIIRELLLHGANPGLSNRDLNTALHLAIANKHIGAAHILISVMTSFDYQNNNGNTPLMLAAITNSVPIINRLAPLSDLYIYGNSGYNALHLASFKGSKAAVEKLLDLGMDINIGSTQTSDKSESGLTPIHLAAIRGQTEVYLLLKDKGADLLRTGSKGSTLLNAMVESNSETMFSELIKLPQFYQETYQISLAKSAAIYDNILVLRQLYLNGAKLNVYDEYGMTPLHYAAHYGNIKSVKFLLEAGISANTLTSDSKNETAAELAMKAKKINVAELLITYMDKKELPSLPIYSNPNDPHKPIEIKVGNTPPLNFKKGLTNQEQTLIDFNTNHKATSGTYALALRIKKELGIELFRMLFSSNTIGQDIIEELSKTMSLMLEIGDAGRVKDIWKIQPIAKCNAELAKVYAKMMADKFPEVSPAELAKKFSTKSISVEHPITDKEATKLQSMYEAILIYGKSMQSKSTSEIIKIAQEGILPRKKIAAIRECVFRTYKMLPYNTQIFALLALTNPVAVFKGRIGKINTGEGKSLIIAMTTAYYALDDQYVDVVAPLAKRDQLKFAPLFELLGLTSSHICVKHPTQTNFKAKIIYGRSTDFEFALLREQLSNDDARFALGSSRPLDVGIVDEADDLFIDRTFSAARIAIPSSKNYVWLYKPYLDWIKSHDKFDLNGVKKYLQTFYFSGDIPTDEELYTLYISGRSALKYQEKIQYIIENNKIVIVDHDNTGRLSEGCRWNNGLHSFVEAKHNLPIQPETLTAASISHVAYFKGYKTLIGVTGTVGEDQEVNEVRTIYNVDIFDVPPHLPSQLLILPPSLHHNETRRNQIITMRIQEIAPTRPVLVLLATIKDSINFSKYLSGYNIKHQVLNAVQQEDEEYILARAGEVGMVTIATNTAGRGTDIILSAQAKKNGGLYVMMGSLSKNLRVERQGKGRAGRQGQPGSAEVVVHTESSEVQALIKPYALETVVAYKTLQLIRSFNIKQISEQRIQAAKLSMVTYFIFSNFSQTKQNLGIALDKTNIDTVQKSYLKNHLGELWAKFYELIEHSSCSEEAMLTMYKSFLDKTVKPIFTGHENLQNLITMPIYLGNSFTSSVYSEKHVTEVKNLEGIMI